jgi:AmmeMemoRadiSam system protein B/AmmeMemoRadiSam system protein A
MKFFHRRFLGALLLLWPAIASGGMESSDSWQPRFAGRFYPAKAGELRKTIADLSAKSGAAGLSGRPFAIIAPHAAYGASGAVAVHAFNAVKGLGFTRAMVLAPSHRKAFRGVSVLDVKDFVTPLGAVKVDREAARRLLSDEHAGADAAKGWSDLIVADEGAYAREHSLEVELPFLQEALGDFSLVPIVVGHLQGDDFGRVADAIRPLLDERTLLIVSSDFTHYGSYYGYEPFPKDGNTEKNIAAIDKGAFGRILAKDASGLWAHRLKTGVNTCGIMPILLALELFPEDAQGTLLKYDTSGRIGGDFSASVSYAAFAFTRPGRVAVAGPVSGASEAGASNVAVEAVSGTDKEALLKLARTTLQTFVGTGKYPGINEANLAKHPRLQRKEGVFVSLYKKGALRGCIGTVGGQMPLYLGVMSNAASAASKDGRFSPVTSAELPDIKIEISVLSEPRRIAGPKAYDIKRDGIMIKKGAAHGVFLPGVAANFNWNLFITLRELCRKAGLPLDAWKDGDMEFYAFSSTAFGEE